LKVFGGCGESPEVDPWAEPLVFEARYVERRVPLKASIPRALDLLRLSFLGMSETCKEAQVAPPNGKSIGEDG
jgi:hypothetical protein